MPKNTHLVPPIVRLTPEEEVRLRMLLAVAPELVALLSPPAKPKPVAKPSVPPPAPVEGA